MGDAADLSSGSAPTVLFFTDNGHGLGHITRLMAVAGHAEGRFVPAFLTMSEAFPLLRSFGFPSEYLPSHHKLGVGRSDWYHLFSSRLAAAVRRLGARMVVIDHIGPPDTLTAVRDVSQGVDFVWSRRGLWRPDDKSHRRLSLSTMFDAVVEPGDLAGAIDVGATATDRHRVEVVPPVLIVAPEEMAARREARTALGLPSDGRAFLVQLSDSDPGRLAALIGLARAAIVDAVTDEPVQVVAPLHVLHRGALPHVDGVHMVPVYPMAKYLKAFDGVVTTAGYNSFHEVMASGVPAVVVARDTGSLDDQVRRAEFASLVGRGFFAPSVDDPAFADAVRRMVLPGEPRIASAVTEALGPMDGAERFADLISARLASRGHDAWSMGNPAVDDSSLRRMRSEIAEVDGMDRRRARRTLVVAAAHDDDSLAEVVARIGTARGTLSSNAVVLVGDVDPRPLTAAGIRFETVMTHAEWRRFDAPVPYATYLDERIDEVRRLYGCDTVVTESGSS